MGNGASIMPNEDDNVRSFNGHVSHMNTSKLKTENVSDRPAYSDKQQCQGSIMSSNIFYCISYFLPKKMKIFRQRITSWQECRSKK